MITLIALFNVCIAKTMCFGSTYNVMVELTPKVGGGCNIDPQKWSDTSRGWLPLYVSIPREFSNYRYKCSCIGNNLNKILISILGNSSGWTQRITTQLNEDTEEIEDPEEEMQLMKDY